MAASEQHALSSDFTGRKIYHLPEREYMEKIYDYYSLGAIEGCKLQEGKGDPLPFLSATYSPPPRGRGKHTHTHRLEGRECRSQMLLLRGCHCRQPGCAHGVDFSGPDNGTLPGASQCFLWHHHKPGGPSPTKWNILVLVQTFEEVPWFPSQIF